MHPPSSRVRRDYGAASQRRHRPHVICQLFAGIPQGLNLGLGRRQHGERALVSTLRLRQTPSRQSRPAERMKTLKFLSILTVCLMIPHATFAADSMQLGEKWVYEHKGHRPMTDPPQPFTGDRVHEVVDVKGEGDAKRWSLKHTWGENDENPGFLHVDGQKRLHQVDVNSMSLTFAPPLPLEWSELDVGESTTFITSLSVMGFEVPIRYEVKRLRDETVTVPAGKFESCRRVHASIHATDAQGQASETQTDYWFHSKANGLVKEVSILNSHSADTHTSTSSLKSHTGRDQ